MEHFVHVPASLYNKSSNTQSVAKQELPHYQAERNPSQQIDSLKKEKDRNLFVKSDVLSGTFALSSYEAIKLTYFNNGWC